MKITKQLGHQGDTQWYEITEIPSDAKKVSKRFIAKSEQSGSVHALFGNYDMYEVDGGFCVDVKEECILNHSFEEHVKNLDTPVVVPKKDHRHSTIVRGKYFVGIQQRFDPLEGWLQEVKD